MGIFPQPQYTLTSKSASYSALPGDAVLGTGGAEGITVTLPPVAPGVSAGPVIVRKIDAGVGKVKVITADGSTIDGVAGATGVEAAAQHDGFTFVTDGTHWFVIGL